MKTLQCLRSKQWGNTVLEPTSSWWLLWRWFSPWGRLASSRGLPIQASMRALVGCVVSAGTTFLMLQIFLLSPALWSMHKVTKHTGTKLQFKQWNMHRGQQGIEVSEIIAWVKCLSFVLNRTNFTVMMLTENLHSFTFNAWIQSAY